MTKIEYKIIEGNKNNVQTEMNTLSEKGWFKDDFTTIVGGNEPYYSVLMSLTTKEETK